MPLSRITVSGTPRDTVFTTVYSVRTAAEGVYTLLGVDRGVPEVFGSVCDVRCLPDAARKTGGAKPTGMKLPWAMRLVESKALERCHAV